METKDIPLDDINIYTHGTPKQGGNRASRRKAAQRKRAEANKKKRDIKAVTKMMIARTKKELAEHEKWQQQRRQSKESELNGTASA